MLRLAWRNETCSAGFARSDTGALASDGALETLVLLALFTDREATAEEIDSGGLDQQRGWWADAESVRPAGVRPLGSKLWLLRREVTTLATLRRAQLYALESLLWLKDEGLAARIEVVATRPGAGILALEVKISRPSKLAPPFQRLWEIRHHAL